MKREITAKDVGLTPAQLAVNTLLRAEEFAVAEQDAETLIEVARGLLAVAYFEQVEDLQVAEQSRLDAAERRAQEDWEAEWTFEDEEPDEEEAQEVAEPVLA